MYSFHNNFLKDRKRGTKNTWEIQKKYINIDKHNHIKVTLNINNLNTPTERLPKNSR